MAEKRLLILGGTGEARALAGLACELPGLRVTTSLAGRTKKPEPVPGKIRSGGFGGASTMADELHRAAYDMVIDATHPFAAAISAHAAEACAAANVELLTLARPPWREAPSDRWIDAADMADAAEKSGQFGPDIFITTGRRGLQAFSGLQGCRLLVRLVDAPQTPLPIPDAEVITGRGPFGEVEELALMQRHHVTCLVAKNSGGDATYGKIAAARSLGVAVVMLTRPSQPSDETVSEIDDALAWINERL